MMNRWQTTLYGQLMQLVAESESFYFQDFSLDGLTYRIFNYRLASYTEFMKPGALESRGIMFELVEDRQESIDEPGSMITELVPLRVAALPMEKFFNLNENPMTMNLDMRNVIRIEDKADGSLISTYLHNDNVRLKSRGSISSEQAIDAMAWLETQPDLKETLQAWGDADFTVNMEWLPVRLDHRIVIRHQTAMLKILNVRNMRTGDYIDTDLFIGVGDDVISCHYRRGEVLDVEEFVAQIPNMVNVEGFVLEFENGLRAKIKTNWYMSLHHVKDSVNNPRRLFEAILDEGIDDVRAMFHDDAVVIAAIDSMQAKVDALYNPLVKDVEGYFETHKHLDRKTYAITGQEHFRGRYGFNLAMSRYLGRPTDYKQFLKDRWKELGLRDTSLEKGNEIVSLD